MSSYKNIFIISEAPQDYPALSVLARKIGGNDTAKVHALWIGDIDQARGLIKSGVDVVWFVQKGPQDLFERYTDALIDRVISASPDVILCASSKRLRLFAAQVAALLKTRVLNDVNTLFCEDGQLYVEHMVYGGSAIRRERVMHPPAVLLASEVLLQEEAFEGAVFEGGTQDSAEIISLTLPQNDSRTLLERKVREREAVNLSGAQTVISVGRGIEKKEDLQLIKDLADVLQAEIACTRPLAEGVCWLPRERYIGVSGAILKPKLFIAIGLSGQIQHMVGANRAKTIAAINNDKNAPLFKQADYGMVGNLYEIVPLLLEALK